MKYKVDKETGCWNFTGSKDSKGYGKVRRGGVLTGAHRYALSETLGRPIAPGRVVMHSCDNPSCINPQHLSEGTQSQNMRDCISKGRGGVRGGQRVSTKAVDWQQERIDLLKVRSKQGWSISQIAKFHKWCPRWIRKVMQEKCIKIHKDIR